MIFYFSATGNSLQVAKKLEQKTGEQILNIAECVNKGNYCFSLEKEERLGFVFPTYFWGLPSIVSDFVKQLKTKGYSGQYSYMVTTYGSICGGPHYELKQLLKGKNILLNGCFNVKMVDVWTPIFDVSNAAKNDKETQEAQPIIDKICELVANRSNVNLMKRTAPGFTCKIAGLMYESSRKTKNFHLEKECNACGLCEKNCPVGAIAIENGKPTWKKDKCTICLRCLHHCPKFAIQYGSKTKGHGQFVNRG